MLWHYAARKNYESRPLIVMVYELVQVRVQVSSTNDGAQWHEKGSHSFSEWNFIVGYGRLTKIVIRFAFHFVIYFIYYTQTYIYISCLAFLHILFLVHSAHSINTLRISLQCSIWNWSIKSSVCLSLGTKLIAFHCMYFIVEKKNVRQLNTHYAYQSMKYRWFYCVMCMHSSGDIGNGNRSQDASFVKLSVRWIRKYETNRCVQCSEWCFFWRHIEKFLIHRMNSTLRTSFFFFGESECSLKKGNRIFKWTQRWWNVVSVARTM